MASPKSPVSIRPMERSDISDCATLLDAAFYNDELFTRLYPRYQEYPHELRDRWVIRLRERIVDPTVECVVAEVTNGEGPSATKEIVGIAIWMRLGRDAGYDARLAKDTYFKSEYFSFTCCKEGRPTLTWRRGFVSAEQEIELERYLLSWEMSYHTFFDHSDMEAAKKMNSVRYECLDRLDANGWWLLANLAVPPTHQRRGIGSALVSWGKDLATKDQLPIALQASVLGRLVYVKHGFKVAETKQVLEGMEDGVAMIWEADDSESSSHQ